MTFFTKTIIFSSILLVYTSCVDPIDLNVDLRSGLLVIEGEITDAKGPHLVRVSISTEKAQVTRPLGGASVVLFDDQGNQEQLLEEKEGQYWHYGNSVKGEKGGTYFLEVTLPSGKVYRSIPETMPTENAEQQAYYENNFVQELNQNDRPFSQWRIQIFNNVSIPETENPLFLRWNMHEVYRITQTSSVGVKVCYPVVFSKTHNFSLYNGEELDATTISNQFINDRTFDFTFKERHYFNVVQASLTREAFEYWSQVDEILNSTGSIFDTPPAAIVGNIYNINNQDETVLGYFEASARDTSRFYVLPGNVPPAIILNWLSCQCDCLQLPYSTLERPYYF